MKAKIKFMSESTRPNVYQYEDYRAFLKDFIKFLKETSRYFSMRSLAKKVGFGSPNYIQSIVSGKRNLSEASARKVGKAFKLSERETKFLLSLLAFNQAETEEERKKLYEKIINNKSYQRYRPVEKAQFEYFSKWYLPVIREMVGLKEFREDYSWIASKLYPRITADQAQAAIRTLRSLGLLERDDNDNLVQASPSVTTGSQVDSLHVLKYHESILQKANHSLMNLDVNQREFRSLLLTCRKEDFQEIQQLIFEMRDKLLERFPESTEDSDQVYSVSVQLFPMTD